jgi:hypothetical protein
MGRICCNGRATRFSTTRENGRSTPRRSAMVRGESHRAIYRMHHFQPSGIYETGSNVTVSLVRGSGDLSEL